MRLPKIVYKFRNWENPDHKRMISHNEIYLAYPMQFNDPFDCGITQSFNILSEDEKSEYISDALINLLIEKNNSPLFDALSMNKLMENRFKDIQTLQRDFDQLHFSMQNKHFGIFSCSSTWRSILMWSHYANCHKGFCVGFDRQKIQDICFGIIGNVLYQRKYPLIKPKITRYDKTFMIKTFTERYSKAYQWKYEHEFRLMRTLFPETFDDEKRKVPVSDDCILEVILGINSVKTTRAEILSICKQKNIPVYLAVKNPYEFSITRKLI